jgi:hypothetical protein
MQIDYYSKYLKYKAKYLTLQKTLIGGTNFDTVYNDIKLTDAHMDELGIKTHTADALKEAMRLLKEGKVPLGVINKENQPNWYKDNPTFFTISNNPNLLKEFYEILDTFEFITSKDMIKSGGTKHVYNSGSSYTPGSRAYEQRTRERPTYYTRHYGTNNSSQMTCCRYGSYGSYGSYESYGSSGSYESYESYQTPYGSYLSRRDSFSSRRY